MKRIFTILLSALVSIALLAQAPAAMDFQSLVRDASGNFVSNQTIGVRITILQGSATGTEAYTETHQVATNANGLLTLTIGAGTTTGSLASVDWANGPYFIKTEMDPTGGTDYTLVQTTQMMSVPYALYANKAGNVPDVSALEARIAALENATSGSPVFHSDGFSVSPGHQVKFAKGNLTYNSSTQKYGLETTQYASGSDIKTIITTGKNIPADRTYSPQDHGYLARTDIGGNWRTLSSPEWGFLLDYRKNAKNLRGKATVNGVKGFVILPDGWVKPSGITFTPTIADFTTNNYTTTQWKTLENNGAIFLWANLSYVNYLTTSSWITYGGGSGACDSFQIPTCTIVSYCSVSSSSFGIKVRLVEDYY